MKQNTAFTIDGIEMMWCRSRRRRRSLAIVVHPSGSVRVIAPAGLSWERLHRALSSKMAWVEQQLKRLKDIARRQIPKLVDVTVLTAAEKKARLVERLASLAKLHDFHYNKITIRNQRSRWGSCSAHNSISLNIKLVQLPDHLIDYIILHELLHTRIKNHSKEYWNALDQFVGDARALRKEVRSYHLDMMA